MKISIITPTILRPYLINACQSVINQTYTNWEHIIVLDSVTNKSTDDVKLLLKDNMDDRQSIIMCDKERRPKYTDYGWFATNYAQNFTTGDYICYLSDDDYFLSSDGLEKIVHQIDNEDVVLFPLSYDGGILSPNNPVFEHIDGQQILHKPIVRGEPVRCQYSSFYGEDGYFINRLWGIAESKKAIQDPPLVHHTRWRHGDFI